MDSIDYTIRSIPEAVDAALRRLALEQSKSLDRVVLETLQHGLIQQQSVQKHHDLDFVIGTWKEDPESEAALAEFNKVDQEAWK